MAKIKKRIVIRNMDDLIELQVMRWKIKYPDAAEPEEWSPNEISPDDNFDPSQEISEEDIKVISADDTKRIALAALSGIERRGSYEKGAGHSANPDVQKKIKDEQNANYIAALTAAAEALSKELDLSDEYEIVFEGEYAEKIMAEQGKAKEEANG